MSAARLRPWLVWFGVLAATAACCCSCEDGSTRRMSRSAFLLVVLGGKRGRQAARSDLRSRAAAFVVFNWFFLRPYNTLIIADPLDWLVLLAFLVTGIVAAQLLERQRRADRDCAPSRGRDRPSCHVGR